MFTCSAVIWSREESRTVSADDYLLASDTVGTIRKTVIGSANLDELSQSAATTGVLRMIEN